MCQALETTSPCPVGGCTQVGRQQKCRNQGLYRSRGRQARTLKRAWGPGQDGGEGPDPGETEGLNMRMSGQDKHSSRLNPEPQVLGGRRLTVLKSGFSGHMRWRCCQPHISFVTMLTIQVQSSGRGLAAHQYMKQSPRCTEGLSKKGTQDLPGPPPPPPCRQSHHACSHDRRQTQ